MNGWKRSTLLYLLVVWALLAHIYQMMLSWQCLFNGMMTDKLGGTGDRKMKSNRVHDRALLPCQWPWERALSGSQLQSLEGPKGIVWICLAASGQDPGYPEIHRRRKKNIGESHLHYNDNNYPEWWWSLNNSFSIISNCLELLLCVVWQQLSESMMCKHTWRVLNCAF